MSVKKEGRLEIEKIMQLAIEKKLTLTDAYRLGLRTYEDLDELFMIDYIDKSEYRRLFPKKNGEQIRKIFGPGKKAEAQVKEVLRPNELMEYLKLLIMRNIDQLVQELNKIKKNIFMSKNESTIIKKTEVLFNELETIQKQMESLKKILVKKRNKGDIIDLVIKK